MRLWELSFCILSNGSLTNAFSPSYFILQGYWVRVWGPPVALEDLTDEYLQSYVDQNGGFKTYSAMQAYKLTNHPVGIFLNYDSMINNNIDSAIDYVASGVPPEDTTVIEQPWYAKDIDTGLGVLIPDPNAMFHRKFYGTSREGYHGISMDFTMFRPDLDQYFILKYVSFCFMETFHRVSSF